MKTKICTGICGLEKSETEEFFYFRKDRNIFRSDCKECIKEKTHNFYIKNKDRIIKRNNLYRKKNKYITKKIYKTVKENFPWKLIFWGIKERCINKKMQDYKYYGGKGIKCLITEEELKFLWFRDKAYLMDKPSIDRENSNNDYVLENCRFIELSENIAKSHRKIILQYNLKGKFIKEWKSISEASRSLNIYKRGISQCLNGHYKFCHDFIWKFKEN